MPQNFMSQSEKWLNDGVLVLATTPPYPSWPAIVLDDPVTKKWYKYDDKEQLEVYVLFLEWWDQNKITYRWIKASSLEQYEDTFKVEGKKVLKRDMEDLQKATSFANKLMKLSPNERKHVVESKYEKPPDSKMYFNGALVLATVPYYPAWPSIISEDPQSGKWWKYTDGDKNKYEVYVIFLEWLDEGKVTYNWMKPSSLKSFQERENEEEKKLPKKYEHELRKAFNFAKTLHMLPNKSRLKETYLKYGLNPEAEAQLKQKEEKSRKGRQQTKRKLIFKSGCKETTIKNKNYEQIAKNISNENKIFLSDKQLQNQLRIKEIGKSVKDSEKNKKRKRKLKELNDCKETIVTYKKYRKLEMVKEKLIKENNMFSNQLQIQNYYHQKKYPQQQQLLSNSTTLKKTCFNAEAEFKLKNKSMDESSKGSKQTKKRKIKSMEEVDCKEIKQKCKRCKHIDMDNEKLKNENKNYFEHLQLLQRQQQQLLQQQYHQQRQLERQQLQHQLEKHPLQRYLLHPEPIINSWICFCIWVCGNFIFLLFFYLMACVKSMFA